MSRSSDGRQTFLAELARLMRGAHRHGLRRSLRLVAASVGRVVSSRHAHVWYRLNVHDDFRTVPLSPGVEVVRAVERDLHWLDHFPTVSRHVARRRLSQGADLWIALEGQCAAFSCWTFRQRTREHAAAGWLELPAHTVGLEESVIAPGFHGHAIAPAVWSAVAERLAHDQIDAIVTKVEEANLPCRRAMEQIGFRAVASMRWHRAGGHARMTLHEPAGTSAEWAGDQARR
jgi:hypothetical protein